MFLYGAHFSGCLPPPRRAKLRLNSECSLADISLRLIFDVLKTGCECSLASDYLMRHANAT